ncbi:hypothetical protein EV182_001051, partial [Spiromyces aspiralis]
MLLLSSLADVAADEPLERTDEDEPGRPTPRPEEATPLDVDEFERLWGLSVMDSDLLMLVVLVADEVLLMEPERAR